jgi:AraC-like DNA-binding protein
MYTLNLNKELEDTYTPGIPPSLDHNMISNADETFHTTGDYGTQLFQVIKCKNFEAWQIDFDIKKDTILRTQTEIPLLDMYIAMQNDFKYNFKGMGEVNLLQRRFNFIYSPGLEGELKVEKSQHYQHIEIHPTLELLQGLLDSFPILDKFLDRVANGETVMLSKQHPSVTSDMLAIIFRILNNSYTGAIKELYIETKLFELLILGLHQSAQTNVKQDVIVLKDYEIERIHKAKNYLIENMDTPCSISWLARHLKISERKLRVGFKQEYGTTPFDFILESRLDKAMELLLTTNTTIHEMSVMTGYSHVPNFIAAFTRKFGHSPGSFLKKK